LHLLFDLGEILSHGPTKSHDGIATLYVQAFEETNHCGIDLVLL